MSELSPRNNCTDDPPSNSQQNHFNQARNVYYGDVHYHNKATDFDIDEAENNLRKSLRHEIQVMTDLQESESVVLQVAEQSRPLQEVFGTRVWFDETSNEDNAQFYDMYKLFEQSMICSTETANQQYRSQIAKENFIQRNGNVVGANGIAGIGKTTMIKLIAKNTNETTPAPKPPLIFFVSLRNIDFSKPCSVLQFLTSSMLSDWDHTPESDKALLKRINDADDVHIFTDALDEARGLNVKYVAPMMSLYDTATPDVIFKNLYSGHLLPKAKKLFTSRPGSFHDLHPNYKPEFGVTVLGLSKESQELLCQQICENAVDAEKVKAMLASNPSLSSLCFVPMFCRMTVSYLLQNISSDVPLLSSSDMFASSLDQCVRSDHFKGDISNVFKLTKLALDGFCNDKLTFDVNDLQAAGVDNATTDAFMSIDVAGNKSTQFKILDGDKRYYFSHLSWHEFFSATQLIFCSSDDQFRDFTQHFHEHRWYSVVKFLFGLSNPLVLAKMQSMFPQTTTGDLSQKIEVLKSFLQSSLQHYCDIALHFFPPLRAYTESSCLSDIFKSWYLPENEKLLIICSWVYELQDDSISRFIADLLPEQLLLLGSILPSDVTCLCHMLASTRTIKYLSIGTYFASDAVMFVGDGLKRLMQSLRATPHKLKKLHVQNQEMNINDFHHFLNDIEELTIKSCNLSFDDVQQIFQALQQRLIPIERLELTGNQIISSSIENCVRSLPMIQALDLDQCNLSEDFIEQLTKAIESLEFPMTSLNLRRNQIRKRGIENLSPCIHNIKYLGLNSCKLSGNEIEMLANKIAEMDEPMQMLDLGNNEIGSSGLRSLTRCIHKIQSLRLKNCNLTEVDVKMLANTIKDLVQPMNLLSIGNNDIVFTGVRYLCRCLHNLQHLWIFGCELTGEDMEMLTDAIRQRDRPIESLRIDFNRVEEKGAIAISRCLHKIKLLTVRECNLSEVGIEAMRSTNARNEQKCEIFGLDLQ